MSTSTRASLRMRIAEETITLRGLNDDYKRAKASAESGAIAAAGGTKALGANDTERKAALDLAVLDSPSCNAVLKDIRKHEATLERLNAELSDVHDSDQRQRWITRGRLVEVLDQLSLAQPERFFSGRDIDTIVDEVTGEIITTRAASVAARPAPAQPRIYSSKVQAYHAEAAGRSQAQHDVDELFGED